MLTYFIGFAVAILFMLTATKIVDLIIRAPGYEGKPTWNFDGRRFHNISKAKGRTLVDVFKWCLTKDEMPWQDLTGESGLVGPRPEARVTEGVQVTFVNHATFLLQCEGMNILTDPVWSLRASPFQWIGPKRMRPPGICFEDLPEIDVVLISHNHYDHLDIHTVKRLEEAFNPTFIVPLGVSAYLEKEGTPSSRIKELNWWQGHQMPGTLKVTAVPAQHFSGRGLSDRDRTLWCGYVMESGEGTFYFAGDTGYDHFFRDIGEEFSIDLAFLPIGAYKPRWFMTPIHIDPSEAVQAHLDVGAVTSIGMHFGTFPLADEGMNEPIRDLEDAKEEKGLDNREFMVFREGEGRYFRLRQAEIRKRAVGE